MAGNIVNFSSLTAESLEESCENLVDLEAYNEGIILHHIRRRFAADTIYTLVSNILIALNPYKAIDLYSAAVIDRIYGKVKRGEDAPPHVFSIAAAAVHRAKHEAKDQSVLISGESGAGKTEATKKILQFVSTVCASGEQHAAGASIEHQILDTNPLLESFGNAKTIRNNNSSRFGKYMEVNFDRKFHIRGCQITAYLLEKSRVVRQGPNERNYHVFYMLLAGANKDWRRDFFLKPADEFAYLSQSGCVDIDRRDELREFDEMLEAMRSLQIDFAQQTAVFQALAAILHLGNLQFQSSRDVEGGSKVTAPAEARRVAALLGVDADSLERVLCHKDATINGESLLIPLTPEKALDQRDSLAKFVYAKLFDFVVGAANASLFRGKDGVNIGVLDIFGFEVFQLNSFEQLCINYCNERLQTFFNEVIFEGEMRLYQAEGLPLDDITYQDNLGCVRLIDLRGAGLFAYLDEECSVPKGSDEKFVSKLNLLFDEAAATKSPFFLRNHKSPLAFTVRHFAGDVHYNARDFLDKNRDALPEGLLSIVARSTVLAGLAPAAASAATPAEASGGPKKAGRTTLSAKFKADLDALMATLRATQPHFIRCVKPNTEQVPTKFDAPLALNQLKYSGLFEAIRIRKAGYEVRLPHEVFVRRYRHCTLSIAKELRDGADRAAYAAALLDVLVRTVEGDAQLQARRRQLEKAAAGPAAGRAKPGAAAAAAAAQPPRREVFVGKTRVFLRSQVLKLLFDEVRERSRGNLLAPLQALVRGHLTRVRLRPKLAALRVSPEEKARQRAREADETRQMTREDAAAQALENVVRGDRGLQERLQRAKQQRLQDERDKARRRRDAAATHIQRLFRGGYVRTRARVFLCERLLERVIAQRAHLSRDATSAAAAAAAASEVQSPSPTRRRPPTATVVPLNVAAYETALQRALQRPLQWRVSSRLITFYSREARKIALQLLEEGHAEQALRDAVAVQSLPLLREALAQAERLQLAALLPSFGAAQETLRRLQSQRAVLALLAEHLSQSPSVPRLLSVHYDALRWLTAQAVAVFGLQREAAVRDAVHRLKQTQSLFELRQALRRAVEVCAPGTMKALMLQRRRHVKFFGDDFLREEAVAVENTLHMLAFQQSLLSDADGAADAVAGAARSMNMHEIYQAIVAPAAARDAESDESKERTDDEAIYLPRFVREPLQRLRRASQATPPDAELAREAQAEFVALVPSDFARRFYVRVFKWSVAFATWHSTEERVIRQLEEKLAAQQETAVGGVQPAAGAPDCGAVSLAPSQLAPSQSSATVRTSAAAPAVALGRRTFASDPTATSPLRSASPAKATGPFAHRMTKSEVAAREVLKKGQRMAFRHLSHRTDTLISATIADYGQ